MKLLKEIFQFRFLGFVIFIFNKLPLKVSLSLGRWLGGAGYYLLLKKRAVVYANLKTVFCREKSPQQLQSLTRLVFVNLTQSFVELFCMAKMKEVGFSQFVELKGREHVDQAIAKGKGVIFLAIHSGNWELASVLNSLTGYPYNVVAHEQPKMPQLALFLNECRQLLGAKVISVGIATKGIINVLKRNETVGLLLDQGGQQGVRVSFLGKTASMSSGAIRLALKYDCVLCPTWFVRKVDGTHSLEFFKAVDLTTTGDLKRDIRNNVQLVTRHFENLLMEHPQEYLWFYKVFKHTIDTQIVILDDGQDNHLQQAQTLAKELENVLKSEGKEIKEDLIKLDFRSSFRASSFFFYILMSRFLCFLRNEGCLQYFLSKACYEMLMSLKADVVISCGIQSEGVNFILSKNHQAKSVILKPKA